jgi:hypothetical protein
MNEVEDIRLTECQFKKEIRGSKDHLIVGIDIAKEKHHAFFGTATGKTLFRRLIFDNTIEGFEKLLTQVRAIQVAQSLPKAVFGVEPTANYHKPLGEHLIKCGRMVVLVSGVAVKRNRELLDGRWDKHDTKDAANIADLISQWVSPDHPRFWSGRFGQGDRRPGQPLPLSKPEAGAQDGRLGSECRPERENLGFGDPGYFQKGKSRSALCLISLNFKTWIRDDGHSPRAGCRILI